MALDLVWRDLFISSFGECSPDLDFISVTPPAYAKQLARKGLDVVLISRSAEKLKRWEMISHHS